MVREGEAGLVVGGGVGNAGVRLGMIWQGRDVRDGIGKATQERQ